MHTTELLTYPFPWSFQEGRAGIILIGDSQLEQLAADPDRKIDISVSTTPRMHSLRELCADAQHKGHRTLLLAFDYFWAQYRREFAGKARHLWPDTPRYIELIGTVARVAREYGLGMELSVLSPLEIGHGYHEQTGERGRWLHACEGPRDPVTGAYSVQLWRQLAWTNNKGTVQIADAGVRVFAFREERIPGTPYHVVDPSTIAEVTATADVEVFEGLRTGAVPSVDAESDPSALAGYGAVRIRVHGQGRTEIGPLDRVLVIQAYETPEMDYFSDSAVSYLEGLLDRYIDAGVRFNALYADEMHIQGDWGYATHHDHGEFALRYVSPGFEQTFARRYGAEYRDFAKWLVYVCRGQHGWRNDVGARSDVQHVLGTTPEAIAETALLRSRYLSVLNDGVVELFAGAKAYLEQRMGHAITSRAHATWAESPTIDHIQDTEGGPWRWKYEYNPRFLASNTIHQAATACHDYFKWCEFLHGTGNDTAECGWLDRNYWGFALASSLGTINRVRNAYAAHWGMPKEVHRRRSALQTAWGTWPGWAFGIVQNMEPRCVDVLTLYPNDLVAWNERFGSWMTQYAYTNYMPQAQVLEFGTVADGVLTVGTGRYTTVVVAFEPFPSAELLFLLRRFAEGGGRVVWSGMPPRLLRDGSPAATQWEALTGVRCSATAADGRPAPGHTVTFEGVLADTAPMDILTDMLPDRVYPLELLAAEPAAQCRNMPVGAHRSLGQGTVTTLGFRPRDDQAASLGCDVRTWCEILSSLGAYPPATPGLAVNDNTEVISRTSDLFTCRFPNGAIAIAPHLKDVEEQWPGGFHRDAETDAAIVAQLDLPDSRLNLSDFPVNGHVLSYTGDHTVCVRPGEDGRILAFAGYNCDRVTVDGCETVLADRPLPRIAWAPVPAEQRVEGGAVYLIHAAGEAELRLPLPGLKDPVVWRAGHALGERGEKVTAEYTDGILHLRIGRDTTWYFVQA